MKKFQKILCLVLDVLMITIFSAHLSAEIDNLALSVGDEREYNLIFDLKDQSGFNDINTTFSLEIVNISDK